MQAAQDNQWRYNVGFFAIMFFALLLIVQTVRIQFDPQAAILRAINKSIYSGEYVSLSAPRGLIYDRYGRLMAGNHTVYEIGVEVNRMKNPNDIALALNLGIGLDYYQTIEILESKSDSKVYSYIKLADFIPAHDIEGIATQIESLYDEESDDSRQADLRGLVYFPHSQRNYPEGELASNILGFVNLNGPRFGIEQEYHQRLEGESVQVFLPYNPNLVAELPETPNGESLVLTIDREIQAMVEKIANDAQDTYKADSVTIVVMQPITGEIYAMTSSPRLDPNRYWEYFDVFAKDEINPFNRSISTAFEPGSVFKIFTMAAALDNGTADLETTYEDEGKLEYGGITIRNWNNMPWGEQDMLGCLQHSLNICMANLGIEMGAEEFYKYMNNFGFGHVTAIDLFGEASGRLKAPGDGDWYPADLATNTFGQGVSVTPIQMMMGATAIVNNGKMVIPHIVKSIISENGQTEISPTTYGQPISAETAQTLTELLAQSLEKEASSALVPNYRLAGKTGTAEIPNEEGYSSGDTNATFLGWGPVDDPQFMVYVWVERPDQAISIWGSFTAAPIFSQVVERLVVLLNIPPDHVRVQLSDVVGDQP
jgi:cell division protein FtsI/penicillin-binding protein 2